MTTKLKLVIFSLVGIGLLLCIAGYSFLFTSNTSFSEDSRIIYIRESKDVGDWLNSSDTNSIISNKNSFSIVAGIKRFKKVKPGRYRISHGMGNNAIINLLRSGNQQAVRIRLDDANSLQGLAGKLGRELLADSADFMNAMLNPDVLTRTNTNEFSASCIYIPDTYDFFWTISPSEFVERMQSIYKNFWTDDRISKAERIGLDPVRVTILASIVKAEAGRMDEAPKIAGLYINRLRNDIPLQSDPTAVFGREHADRIYLDDLRNESPYNTYLHKGLPPGPITLPEKNYLLAVLDYVKHDYIYMCAQPGGTGYHNFSKTLEQHNQYRREYTNWLEKMGIR